MKHIGIVACSVPGAALCYKTIAREGEKRLGNDLYPEVTLHNHCLGEYMKYIETGNQRGVADLMLSSSAILQRAGADFLICPDNTIHEAFPLVEPLSPLPWLHIARVVAEAAGSRGFRKCAVLGTRYLMEGPVYSEALGAVDVGFRIPSEEERIRINKIIFTELVKDIRNPVSLNDFLDVIARLKTEGCDAVVLGCTEIPLIIDDDNSPLPVLDSTRLLARAAVRFALEA